MPTGIIPSFGRPGVGSALTSQRGNVNLGGGLSFFVGGGTIEGTKTRDTGNTDSIISLRPGLPMGKITASGFWANSILGVTSGAYTSGGTSLSASAATVTELVRRFGASGTFKLIGPASAAGANVTATVTYSAASGTTITVTDIGANKIAGCFICPEDGSETIRTFIPDGYNLVLPGAAADTDNADVPFPWIPVAGQVKVDNLLFWPSDTTLRTYYRESLSTLSGGKFVFDDQFTA
jgi:hypothetical protein